MTRNTSVTQIDVIDRVNQAEREVAGIGAKLDAVQESLDRLAKRSDQPTNWVGIGGLVFVAFTYVLTSTSLTVNPLKENQAIIERKQEVVIPALNQNISRILELSKESESLFARVREAEKDTAYIKGKLHGIEQRLEDVDNKGSRELNRITKGN